MIKSLNKFILFILFALSFGVSEVLAESKLDFTEPVSEAVRKVEKVKEKIEQKYNETLEKLNSKIRKVTSGEGSALFKKYVKDNYSNIGKGIANGNISVEDFSLNDLSESLKSQVGNIKQDVVNLENLAEDYRQTLQNEKEEKVRALEAQLAIYQAEHEAVDKYLAQLKKGENSSSLLEQYRTEKQTLEKSLEQSLNNAVIRSKIEELDKKIAELESENGSEDTATDIQNFEAKLNDLEILIANTQGEIKDVMAMDTENDATLQKYKDDISKYNQMLVDINIQQSSQDLLKTLNTKADELFGDDEEEKVQAVYESNIERLFLGENEYEGNTNVARISQARKKEYYEALQNMLRAYLNTQRDIKQTSEKSVSCVDAMPVADGINGQQTMQVCVDLQNAKAAFGMTELLLAKLRFMAIKDMAGWHNQNKLRSYSDDLTVFNLDNYIFTPEDLETKSTVNPANSIKSKLGKVKLF